MVRDARGMIKRDTHIDRIFASLGKGRLRMVGDVKLDREFKLYDSNNALVGSFTLDGKRKFVAGTFYGTIIVSGRTKTQAEALAEFEAEIESIFDRR